MMKWLRIHTKKIMVVVVLLAMFSFVGGSALYNLMTPDRSEMIIMGMFGRDVTQGELSSAQNDTKALESLLLPWKFDSEGKMKVLHWLLLVEEAERAGIVVTDEEIDKLLQSQDARRQQARLGTLEDLRRRRKLSGSMMRRALGRYLTVGKYSQRVAQAAVPSEPQIRRFVHDTQDKVEVRFVALDANSFVVPEETVSDEETQVQFDKYRNVDSSESDTSFGYRYPNRVKLQYVLVDLRTVQNQVSVSLDEIKTYWKGKDGQGVENKSKYKKTVYEDAPAPVASQPTSGPAEASVPEPAKKVPVQRPMTFSEARSQIETELRKKKALKIARQAMAKLADELAKPWRDARMDEETGYKPIPPGTDRLELMKEVCDQVSSRFRITMQFGQTALSSKPNLANNSLFRGATTPGEGDEPVDLSVYAFRIPSFYEVDSSADASLRLQLFQTPLSPLTVSGRGGFEFANGRLVPTQGAPERFVLFRAIEAREAESPASLNEVRRAVERDVRLLHTIEKVEPEAREFCVVARRLGVEKALDGFEDLRTKRGSGRVNKPAAFARQSLLVGTALREAILAEQPVLETSNVPGVGQSDEFIEACFGMTAEDWAPAATELPETDRTRAATTQPALDPAPKVQLIFVRKLQKWFIIELVKSRRVNSEEYETQYRREAFASLLGHRRAVIAQDWFDPTSVEERCGYFDRSAAPPADSGEGLKTPVPEKPIPF